MNFYWWKIKNKLTRQDTTSKLFLIIILEKMQQLDVKFLARLKLGQTHTILK